MNFLVSDIYPGDGFTPSCKNIPAAILELVSIINRYDDYEDREYLIYGIGETLYTSTSEGQGAVGDYIKKHGFLRDS